MSGVVIKNMPPLLHQRLKDDAIQNHRSMTKHIIALLEDSLDERRKYAVPRPVKTRYPIPPEFIDWAKREGRA